MVWSQENLHNYQFYRNDKCGHLMSRNDLGEIPLHLVCKNNHPNVVTTLLDFSMGDHQHGRGIDWQYVHNDSIAL